MTVRMEVRKLVLARDGYRCVACDARSDLTMDHILPQCMYGNDEETNLQTLCKRCNGWKDNSVIDFTVMSRAQRRAWVTEQLLTRKLVNRSGQLITA